MTGADGGLRRDAASRRRARPRVSVIGVIGEVFITAGVVALLFVAWQLWIGDLIIGSQNDAIGNSLSQHWAAAGPTKTPTPGDAPTTGATDPGTSNPIGMAQPADAQVFAVMHIPRFGSDYAVRMAGGVTRPKTLDPIGIGHYPGTAMPGDIGNMALAAHRTTFGKPFNLIATLHVGDAIVIETQDGWYTYRFRTLEYVKPDAIGVLAPVPQQIGVEANGRYLTMTSCSPMYSKAERIVAYSSFESFTPRSAGAPASLAAVS
ncbi:class E sortase [Microbacterium sp. ASV49]|uniref:Class E sortase n=1 Tax=Microbacterium candidum TaxID=3041922 RepID=A0ABT7MUE0_9MICO|nr:class E sortase [Microbacterium sp. ASV49]MDL9978060.1 class E sortase [Microbacterium sp. ASV49]